MKRSQRREHLIDTAIELFCENGYHATGIDKILKQAGVSKKTLYTHFRSKEELIIAALRQYDSLFRNDFMKSVERAGKTPHGRLEAIFDVAERWFADENFFGCMFTKAVSEYSQKDSTIRDIAKQFKRLIRDYIRALCVDAGVHSPDHLADQLALVIEGAIVTAQINKTTKAAKTAKDIARTLLNQAVVTRETGSTRE